MSSFTGIGHLIPVLRLLSLNSLCIYFIVLLYLVLLCHHTHTQICAKSVYICINLLENFVCHKLHFSFKVQLSPQCNSLQCRKKSHVCIQILNLLLTLITYRSLPKYKTVNLLCKFRGWCSLVRFALRNIVHPEWNVFCFQYPPKNNKSLQYNPQLIKQFLYKKLYFPIGTDRQTNWSLRMFC